MADLSAIYEAVINGSAPKVRALTGRAVADRAAPSAVLQEALIPAMGEVGRRMKALEFFVPEVLLSARAMQAGLSVIKPMLAASGVEPIGKVVIGTVEGDLHDIGKNLVGMMLEGAGFSVTDVGTNVKPERFVEAVREEGADVLAMSALLTTTMPNMRRTIQALGEAGLRDRVKVLVGGAPVTKRFADEIGADGHAVDASFAVDVAMEQVGARS